MSKKFLFSLSVLFLLFSVSVLGLVRPASASENVNIYFFWGEGCPHCEHEKPFLEGLKEKYPEVRVHDFEVWKSAENRNLLIEVGKALGANVSGVPFTVIGNQYVNGFLNAETTGKQIENMILNCMSCPDIVGGLLSPEPVPADEPALTPEEVTAVTPLPETSVEEVAEEVMEIAEVAALPITAHFFYTEGCPLCAKEKEFLKTLETEASNLNVVYYDVARDQQAREIYENALKAFDVQSSGLPFLTIGQQYFMGWDSKGETAAGLREAIKCVNENQCPDKIQRYLYTAVSSPTDRTGQNVIPETIHLPLVGEINTKNVSLPFLTFVIAALDGFNPCAMWTLLFLISLLLGMKDRRRMWILGSAFIVASGLVYFIFLAAWLNLLLFLGFVLWVRIMIGLVAIGGGGYYLKEYFTAQDETCKVTNTEGRQRIFAKIRAITHEGHFWLALGGIILLAFAVNLVELICSAGLPAVYTQILVLSDLAKWQYYAYLIFYIFIFMLDDMIVFFVAMITLRMTGLTTKYVRASHLIGGALMVLIGILLIFRPEWLMFG